MSRILGFSSFFSVNSYLWHNNVAAVSISDLDNYSVFFFATFKHYQQKWRVCDTQAAYVNEQTKGKTPQISRERLSVKIYICVALIYWGVGRKSL